MSPTTPPPIRRWYQRQCRYEQLREDFGALTNGLRMSEIIDAEAPTENIETELLIVRGFGSTLADIQALPEIRR